MNRRSFLATLAALVAAPVKAIAPKSAFRMLVSARQAQNRVDFLDASKWAAPSLHGLAYYQYSEGGEWMGLPRN